MEYEEHRPLYDWYLNELGIYHPRQYEFARLNLSYTVLSKRRLLKLVNEGFVTGWTDPRMPTLAGMRRRGYTPEAIRNFCERIGVGKKESLVDMGMLEFCVREDLNKRAQRMMAVLKPIRIIIDNYPDGQEELLDAVNNPEDQNAGTRQIPFSKELYIEQEDFMEEAPKQFFRLTPGREVRLRYAYFIKCESVVKDSAGNITEIHCTYDPATRGGDAPDGRKVKATIHWVSAKHAVPVEVRLYDKFFTRENPNDVEEGREFTDYINPASLVVINSCMAEPALARAEPGSSFQFERLGYFCADSVDSKPGKPVFNRIVTLKDDWVKIQKSGK
jgi:glutaminyl-tRNA synthetase